ncbi:MAG: hypothetical protein QM778_28655 [Myxococcales bacterium]
MNSKPAHRRHAVVVGASIGGMCAARALAPHFERVTVLDKDTLPEGAQLRRGVPQGNQPHALQMRGRRELEALYPGLIDAIKVQGALELDPIREFARLTPHGWMPRHGGTGAVAIAASRPLLESTMRRLLLAQHPNVHVVQGARVVEFLHERRWNELWVLGVRTEGAIEGSQNLLADVVVDATGRGTKTPKWLASVGLPAPEELRVDAHCNYATRHYRAPAHAENLWWRSLIIDQVPPDQPRGCVIFGVEDRRWIVTAIGTDGDYAPGDEAGWLAFLKSLRSPLAYELVRRATPLSEISQSRTTVNRWKQMHRYEGHLNGLLLFGDAVCGFNPSYGQGITASALAASSLARALARTGEPFNRHFLRRYYRAQAAFLGDAWALSTSLDFRWRNTEGAPPRFHAFTGALTGLAEQVILHDPQLMRAAIPLADFGASRWSLMTPSFTARFLRGLWRHALERPVLEQEIDLGIAA